MEKNSIMEPLVSIVVPCYNSEETIVKALASLINQTYSNWEALVVNDGSTDRTKDKVDLFDDPRIRYFEFQENKGRAYARQKALNEAKGQYLSTLDSDDWIYHKKLEEQVLLLESDPDLVVVGGGIAATDGNFNLFGYRFGEKNLNKKLSFEKIVQPKFPNAVCMMRMKRAKSFGYNLKLNRSQDSDFLIKVLKDQNYLISDKIWYVYSELNSVNYWKILNSYRFSLLFFSTYWKTHPLQTIHNIFLLLLKVVFHLTVRPFADIKKILSNRSEKINGKIENEFHKEVVLLKKTMESIQ
jgi:glycosyltransferase involved in cell wall biosynthesis